MSTEVLVPIHNPSVLLTQSVIQKKFDIYFYPFPLFTIYQFFLLVYAKKVEIVMNISDQVFKVEKQIHAWESTFSFRTRRRHKFRLKLGNRDKIFLDGPSVLLIQRHILLIQ